MLLRLTVLLSVGGERRPQQRVSEMIIRPSNFVVEESRTPDFHASGERVVRCTILSRVISEGVPELVGSDPTRCTFDPPVKSEGLRD